MFSISFSFFAALLYFQLFNFETMNSTHVISTLGYVMSTFTWAMVVLII